jgi:hypothetical protein
MILNFGQIALGLVGFLAFVVIVFFPDVRIAITAMFKSTLVFLLGLVALGALLIAITRFNFEPYLRQLSVVQTQHQLIDLYTVLPQQHKVKVQSVSYDDVDGDGLNEWIVFYQFDLADGRSPTAGAVYDADRGDPPAIFPYRLVPPDRDYLSEGGVYYQLSDIVNVGETRPIPELLVYGASGGEVTDLTIFRLIPNSLPWESPRDEPRRYQPVGAFRGDGGVTYDPAAKTVTVISRAYDRSQLAVKTVYALDEARATYMSLFDPRQLAAPVSSRVAFAFGMPADILDSPYPEKLLLGFYTMSGESQPAVAPRMFLAGEALLKYNQNDLAYFGFGNVSGVSWPAVSDMNVTELKYAPQVETASPSAGTPCPEPCIQPGPEARYLIASVTFDARVAGTALRTPAPVSWVMVLTNGKWKIDRHPAP